MELNRYAVQMAGLHGENPTTIAIATTLEEAVRCFPKGLLVGELVRVYDLLTKEPLVVIRNPTSRPVILSADTISFATAAAHRSAGPFSS